MHDADDEPLAGPAVIKVATDEVEEAGAMELENRVAVVEFGDGIGSVAVQVISSAHNHNGVVLVLEI